MLRHLVRRHLIIRWHHASAHHSSVDLLGRLAIRRGRRARIGILHIIAELRNHWSILRSRRPVRLLLRREKGCILRANIKAFRVISTLFSSFSSFASSRPVLHRNGA